ncbi:DNA-binding protein [Phaeosphaeriaceae sp. PMI808]|nr:DNA-binding protein [Phaeosphaeriaceae sp. PMI808]
MAPTYLDSLSAFTSFLTAYTHTLLYLRSLYPQTSFVNSRFHNTSVYQSRHPLVCEWIRDAVSAVHEELLQGSVSRIAVVVFNYGNTKASKTGSAQIMERYMFDVGTFPVVSKNERNMEIEWDDASSDNDNDDSETSDPPVHDERKQKELDFHVDVNLSEQFRAALIALTTHTAQLAPLPPKCSFNISMELKDEAHVDPPIRHPQPWIPVQPSLQKTGRKATVRDEEEEEGEQNGKGKTVVEGSDLGGVKATPIRSVEAGVFRFETWVEEGKAKFENREKNSAKTSIASLA